MRFASIHDLGCIASPLAALSLAETTVDTVDEDETVSSSNSGDTTGVALALTSSWIYLISFAKISIISCGTVLTSFLDVNSISTSYELGALGSTLEVTVVASMRII